MKLQSAGKYSLFEIVNDHINISIMRKNCVIPPDNSLFATDSPMKN